MDIKILAIGSNMALFTEFEIRARAKEQARQEPRWLFLEASLSSSILLTKILLTKHTQEQEFKSHFDVFLSHAYEDHELLYGTVLSIEDLGYSVYIDWRNDPDLDRSSVTPETANRLRERMSNCKCLFYSVTPSAKESAWMKWELGWMDGCKNRAAILPIVANKTERWSDQEFLGLYPYVSNGTIPHTEKEALWIHRSESCYVRFDYWLDGKEPYERLLAEWFG